MCIRDSFSAAISACGKGGSGSAWRHGSMRCTFRDLSPDVINFNTANSACDKGGQWQRMAPLFDEMRRPGP
eukprot:9420262-Karenia_brevis.AAC.1